ncbi:MAG: hypothetical protein NW208_06995 [Bryobacter sp.]|nr:hypothetical protein [Bryobacter sp.]
MKSLMESVLNEFLSAQNKRSEPAYKAELEEERRRRESLERRVNELVEENRRSRSTAEALERETAIKSELQRHGVTKLDLAYRALKDDVAKAEDGTLLIRGTNGMVPYQEHIPRFLDENPELLPARKLSGSGAGPSPRAQQNVPGLDLDSIRPGMSSEEMARYREEISRLANSLDQV